MSYSLTEYSATEVELNDGSRSYYYKKCYCSVELQGEYIIFTSHSVENNAFRQQWSVAYTDFTSPSGSAAAVLAAIKSIIESYAVVSKAYLVAHDENTQTAAVINTGYPMFIDWTDESNGITINSHSQITFSQDGVYNIQFSAQFSNNDNQLHDVDVWFQKNNTPIPWSNSRFTINASHGGNPGHHIAAWNYMSTFVAGDFVEIYWETDNIQVVIEKIAAANDAPDTPSIILTVDEL